MASRGSDIRDMNGRRSGTAGDTSVSVLTRSGWSAATYIEIAPPIEFPNRCTGPTSRPRMNRATASLQSGG